MNNKKIFKSVYDYKFGKDKMRKKILREAEKTKGMNIPKYAIATCLIVIICSGIVLLNKDTNKSFIKDENRNASSYRNTSSWSINSININNVYYVATTSILTYEKAEDIAFDESEDRIDNLKDRLVIPKAFNEFKGYAVYRKNSNTNEYDILNRTIYKYTSSSNKSIWITFKENIKDYHFPTDKKKSIINGITVIIDKHEDSYLAQFSVNDISYDIAATDITIDELESLIISIIG